MAEAGGGGIFSKSHQDLLPFTGCPNKMLTPFDSTLS